MAAVDWAAITGIAPGMAAVSPTGQTEILAWVNVAMKVKLFADGETSARLRMMRLLLGAHFGELWIRRAGVAGPLTGKTVASESLSTSYGPPVMNADALAETSWGRQFNELAKNTPGARLPRVLR